MAKSEETKERELTFAEKLGVDMIELPDAYAVLEIAYKLACTYEGADGRVPVPCWIGESGIGKTYLVKGFSQNKKINCRIMSLASSENVDLKGLPDITLRDGKYKVVEYIKQAVLPRADDPKDQVGGILFLDELNRADTLTLQAVFAIVSGELDDWVRPKGWLIVVAINPHDDVYQVKSMDPALRRRMSMIGLRTSMSAWIKWAKGAGVHPAVIGFVESNPKSLLDEEALKNHKVFSNPASLEKVSAILNEFEEEHDSSDVAALQAIKPLISGYIGAKQAEALLKYYNKTLTAFDPNEIVYRYSQGDIRKRIQACKRKRLDKLGVATEAVRELLIGLKAPDLTPDVLSNVSEFFYDLPNELAMSLATGLTKAEHDGRHSNNWSALLYQNPKLTAKLDELYDTMRAIPVAKKPQN